MQTKEFSPVHLNHLSIDDLFSLSKSTIEVASPVRDSIGELPSAILAQLETDNNAMGVQLKKSAKSGLTPQVTELDIDCDDRLSEVKRNVSTNLLGRNPEKKAAAEALKIFLNPYWDTDTKPLNTQISLTKEMFAKFNANETLKAHAATIGITDMMTGLETANAELSALYQTRNEQVSAVDGPSASSLKSATAKSYDHFCTAVEQAANYTPSDVLTTLFNQMDELRKKYARLVHKTVKEEVATPAKAE
jgi:flagellar biosynthesis chaperone FliJ